MQAPQTSLNLYLKRRRRRRIIIIISGLCFMVVIVALIFYALQDKAGFFRIPSDITAADKISHRLLRLGGYVENGSVKRETGANIRFYVTDFHHKQEVRFNGILPDLFREGQGVIAEGRFADNGVFIADRVLAKHDEKYVPKDVADRIKAAEGRETKNSLPGRAVLPDK
ncbi:MAG: cytochrome c maturation protein CcmE [Candidatus Tokpelaia sp.]|uniref:cytochrome c maturation protein CcmE n=1 Tax=Candidatus Tokpelaia sp. TaxID=2233777 RepID=UPI00123BEF39|nr:cytochrome c maturation protein CcmE [Candidatus Tokpelaia sp.]KAA6206427.1 MAG: cytochrome c maturation protein CcmE [Candidatus Tokpelaia sp.]KAA6207191.1 MAG: cytochrome c maturation protein CcmE [Candidatus Tokpelaia sp.]KAA6405921.1 cytochrome c maturation protein CcmE [Candidatus Tokpelaia sp.]